MNIQAISNKIKYWNLNCYIGINLPLSSCEGETKTVWCHLDMSSTNLQKVNKIYIYINGCIRKVRRVFRREGMRNAIYILLKEKGDFVCEVGISQWNK